MAVADKAPPRDRTLELLEAIHAELRALRADLARTRRPASLTRADHARLSRLLPAIAGALGSEAFIANELADSPAVRLVLDGLTAKQAGRLFQRAVGMPIGALVVERAGTELHRTLWRIVTIV